MSEACLGTVAVCVATAAALTWWNARAAAEKRRRDEEARRQRWESLSGRFGRENANRIMAGDVWQGQTEEMLIEAIGRPVDVEEKVYKTKTKLIYKYHRTGANRYALRVTLENGVVVGWEQK